MPKFAIYQALMARNDWDRERRDKAMNLQALEKSTAITQQKQEAQLKAQQQLGEFLQTVDNLNYEPEDIERLQELEQNERGTIIDGIKKANGDVRSYMASGGLMALNNYKNNIIKSKEAKNAVATKESMAGYIKDRQDGKFISSGYVDVPISDGKVERRYMSMNEQIALFKDKKIDKINYFGSENKINVEMMDFKKYAKDSIRPYGDNTVTMSDVKQIAIGKGASEEQAQQIAENIGRVWAQSGEGWKWGGSSIDDINMDIAKLNQNATRESNIQMRWEHEQSQKEEAMRVPEKYLGEIYGTNHGVKKDREGKVLDGVLQQEFNFGSGQVGGRMVKTPLSLGYKQNVLNTGFGLSQKSIDDSNAAIYDEDGDIIPEKFDIYKQQLNSDSFISPRSGFVYSLRGIPHHVEKHDNQMTHVQSLNGLNERHYLSTSIITTKAGMEELMKQNSEWNNDYTESDGMIEKIDIAYSGFGPGNMYRLNIGALPNDDYSTVKEANVRMLESKTKEEMSEGQVDEAAQYMTNQYIESLQRINQSNQSNR